MMEREERREDKTLRLFYVDISEFLDYTITIKKGIKREWKQ